MLDDKIWNKIDINLTNMTKIILEIGFGYNLWQYFNWVKEYTVVVMEKLKVELDKASMKHFGKITISNLMSNTILSSQSTAGSASNKCNVFL